MFSLVKYVEEKIRLTCSMRLKLHSWQQRDLCQDATWTCTSFSNERSSFIGNDLRNRRRSNCFNLKALYIIVCCCERVSQKATLNGFFFSFISVFIYLFFPPINDNMSSANISF